MPKHDFPSTDPNGQFEAQLGDALRDAIQRANMMRAQAAAVIGRDLDEAQAMANAASEVAYGNATADLNVQCLIVCAVPHGNGNADASCTGFASSMRGAMSAAMSKIVMHEVMPHMAKEWEPSLWGRVQVALRIIFARSAPRMEVTSDKRGLR